MDDVLMPVIDHLVRSTRLQRSEAERVVQEVVAYFSETTEHFVRRRHTELKRLDMANDKIFEHISEELTQMRVVAPSLSVRQIRRLVYG